MPMKLSMNSAIIDKIYLIVSYYMSNSHYKWNILCKMLD